MACGLPLTKWNHWDAKERDLMKNIGERLYDLLLGCFHRNLSRPFTIDGRTYCVCCDCGREFDYSLESMKICSTSDHWEEELPELAVQHSR